MTKRLLTPAVLLLAASVAAAQSPEPGLSKEDVARAEAAVKAHVEKLGGRAARITRITDPALERVASGHAFFWVLFPQFPIGVAPPAGLGVSNVFAVGADRKLVTLADRKSAERFFKEKVRGGAAEAGLKDAVRAWLAVGQQFEQDGFYRFTPLEGETKVAKTDKGHSVSGALMASSGGNGTVRATLEVSSSGEIVGITQVAALRPGPRPICQATKLLDRDPVVRAMAEQDLLYLGPLARDYLFEQRAKAAPELQRAIDRLWWRIQTGAK